MYRIMSKIFASGVAINIFHFCFIYQLCLRLYTKLLLSLSWFLTVVGIFQHFNYKDYCPKCSEGQHLKFANSEIFPDQYLKAMFHIHVCTLYQLSWAIFVNFIGSKSHSHTVDRYSKKYTFKWVQVIEEEQAHMPFTWWM